MDPRRQIPAVDRLLSHPAVEALSSEWSRRFVLAVAREQIESVRAAVKAGAPVPGLDEIAAACADRFAALERPRPRRVINATGVVIHTNLGRAPLGRPAALSLLNNAGTYSNLEFDLESGTRGHRRTHLEELLRLFFPAWAAHAVNNNAAALMLALNTLARGREVVISRGELVEIGGSFRVPEILECSGARLREVGTTNRTHLRDYENALGPETGMILRVWTSNYRVVGFTHSVELKELAELGRRAGIPVIADQGCGRLFAETPGPPAEPAVEELLKDGADLVCFSGDKMLGGPQAGLLIGREELVRACSKNPLARALRPDKFILAALAATFVSWMKADPGKGIPVARMLSYSDRELRHRAEELAAVIRGQAAGFTVEVLPGVARVGGGAAPEEDLPGWLVAVHGGGVSEERLQERLRGADPPVVARVQEGKVLFDPRTLTAPEFVLVARALAG